MAANYPTEPLLVPSERTAFYMQQQFALRAARMVNSRPTAETPNAIAETQLPQPEPQSTRTETQATQPEPQATPPEPKATRPEPKATQPAVAERPPAPKEVEVASTNKRRQPPKQLQRETAERFEKFKDREPSDTWLPEVSLFDPDTNEDSRDYYLPVSCDIEKPIKRSCSFVREPEFYNYDRPAITA